MNARQIAAMIRALKSDLAQAERSRDRTSIIQTRRKLEDMSARLDRLEKALNGK